MQDLIDTIMGNLPFFIGLFVFVVLTIGIAIALSTPAGRDALGRAAVRFAVAALGFAEKWLGEQIVPTRHSAATALTETPRESLRVWLDATR